MMAAIAHNSRHASSSAWRFIVAQPLGALGLAAILAMAGAAALADVIAPYDPYSVDFGAMLSPPSAEHPLGTDAFGRDVASRLMYGARTALAFGLTSALVGSVLGAALGMISAYYGGSIDLAIQSAVDILLSIPMIVMALVLATVMGAGDAAGISWSLVFAISIPMIPKVARVIRSATLSVRQMAYIDAARIAGYSPLRIIARHIAPNVVAPFIIMFTALVAQAILVESSLSFLGVGVNEPTPSWGLMLAGQTADFFRKAPWLVLAPGAAVSFAVLAFNLFGDALRDWLDPRMQE